MISFLPRRDRNNYPLDLDGSDRHTRFKRQEHMNPYPPIIGCITGFMREQDAFILNASVGKIPFGPGMASVPVNLQWVAIIPGLSKQG